MAQAGRGPTLTVEAFIKLSWELNATLSDYSNSEMPAIVDAMLAQSSYTIGTIAEGPRLFEAEEVICMGTVPEVPAPGTIPSCCSFALTASSFSVVSPPRVSR